MDQVPRPMSSQGTVASHCSRRPPLC
jgi:hypothetical protein